MSNNLQIMSSFQMLRTDPAHIGSAPLVSAAGSGAVHNVDEKKKKTSFEEYLLQAANYVNEKQQASSEMSERLITDPDSVDVHDVTIAMAEANLSLSIAQTVIDRISKAWTEITTTR